MIEWLHISYSKTLTNYWGMFLLASLFYFQQDSGITVEHAKNMLFLFAAFTSIILFGTRAARPKDFALCLPFIILGFFNLWHAGSYAGIFQWLNVMAGSILFLQAKDLDFNIIKKYIVFVGILASVSILMGYIKTDYYDLVSNVHYLAADGTLVKGKTLEMQHFHGLLNGIGHTGALIALCASLAGSLGIGLASIALLKIADLNTITPLIALVVALFVRFADSFKSTLVIMTVLIITLGLTIKLSPQVKTKIQAEIRQRKT